MKVLIVTHAGGPIGLGHLSRSLVVARALRDEADAEIHLLIQAEPIQRQELSTLPHEVVPPTEDLCAVTRRNLAAQDYHALVFDLQRSRRPQGWHALTEALRNERIVVAGIDDVLDLRPLLDLAFVPTFYLNPLLAEADDQDTLWGWEYLLLGVAQPRPRPRLGERNALILTGGSDVAGLGARWPTALAARLPEGFHVDWVTGPFSDPPAFPKEGGVSFAEHHAPSGLSSLMSKAGHALTIYGISFFELLYFGIPTVVYSPYGNRDVHQMEALRDAGVALVAETEDEA
ncbi:MAG: hypothetical protein D6720_08485, partial [Gammaproteobacteria bacterium]